MRPDPELKTDVIAELGWDPAINATAIDVHVAQGVVRLTGHVTRLADRTAIERAVRRVYGVRSMVLDLDVKLTPKQQRTDAEIASAADALLTWMSDVPTQQIRIGVKEGWLELRGEVDWDYQRKAVEAQLSQLAGLAGLRNELTLRQQATPADLGSRIERALQRQASREASRIDVRVDAGTVTLRGVAHSLQERDAIVGAAWAAPGVSCVVDEVRVCGRDSA
jgi:osmotically-inducible protein OsmY